MGIIELATALVRKHGYISIWSLPKERREPFIQKAIEIMHKEDPKEISHAVKDGTKYVVYDPNRALSNDEGWVVGYYDTKHSSWFSWTPTPQELNPTHFVPFYGFDVA